MTLKKKGLKSKSYFNIKIQRVKDWMNLNQKQENLKFYLA